MDRVSSCSTSIIVALVLFADTQSLLAGTTVYVGSRVGSDRQVSMDAIDHAAWNALARKYVDQNGMVDYATWQSSSDDVRALDNYLRTLSTASLHKSASRDAKLAFWINAYNAVTVKGILREYPTSSIRNHTAKLWGYNIWKDLQLYVGSQAHSLEKIEHEILRKMGEPRIHFAIVCASIGCPRLLNEAYVPERVNEQLDGNARDFFGRSTNFRYDRRSKTFQLSSILKWFATDFGANQAAQLRAIAPWLPDNATQQAAKNNSVRVSYLSYDWNLNDQSASRRQASRR